MSQHAPSTVLPRDFVCCWTLLVELAGTDIVYGAICPQYQHTTARSTRVGRERHTLCQYRTSRRLRYWHSVG
eukprot:1732515-Rhodomonas_salina.3